MWRGLVSLYSLQSILEGSQGRNSSTAGPFIPWRNTSYWSAVWLLHSAGFLYSPGVPTLGWCCSQWALIKIIPHRHGHRPLWSGQLCNWGSLSEIGQVHLVLEMETWQDELSVIICQNVFVKMSSHPMCWHFQVPGLRMCHPVFKHLHSHPGSSTLCDLCARCHMIYAWHSSVSPCAHALSSL